MYHLLRLTPWESYRFSLCLRFLCKWSWWQRDLFPQGHPVSIHGAQHDALGSPRQVPATCALPGTQGGTHWLDSWRRRGQLGLMLRVETATQESVLSDGKAFISKYRRLKDVPEDKTAVPLCTNIEFPGQQISGDYPRIITPIIGTL